MMAFYMASFIRTSPETRAPPTRDAESGARSRPPAFCWTNFSSQTQGADGFPAGGRGLAAPALRPSPRALQLRRRLSSQGLLPCPAVPGGGRALGTPQSPSPWQVGLPGPRGCWARPAPALPGGGARSGPGPGLSGCESCHLLNRPCDLAWVSQPLPPSCLGLPKWKSGLVKSLSPRLGFWWTLLAVTDPEHLAPGAQPVLSRWLQPREVAAPPPQCRCRGWDRLVPCLSLGFPSRAVG